MLTLAALNADLAAATAELAALDAALATLRTRGVAVRRLLGTAHASRASRAASVNVAEAVVRDGGTRLLARCVGNEEYRVTVVIGAGFMCSCPDHNRMGPCKHVLAVANRFLVNHARPEWTRLTEERAECAAHIADLDGWEDPHPEDMAETLALRGA
jgi:uncharacterized Zn finger protein